MLSTRRKSTGRKWLPTTTLIRRKTMRKLLPFILAWGVMLPMLAQNEVDSTMTKVRLETSMGDIVIALSNLTPLHRDNFIQHVQAKDYDGVLFHRVIKDFMIQTGDLATRPPQPEPEVKKGRNAPKQPKVKNEDLTIEAEICYPQLFHKRGAVAAAREDDSTNPEHRSSGSQFYIVYGWDLNLAQAEYYTQRFDSAFNGKYKATPEVTNAYATKGGSPHLDGNYTVFGEVLEGMDVVEKIQNVDTDDADKPKEDIRIVKAVIVE